MYLSDWVEARVVWIRVRTVWVGMRARWVGCGMRWDDVESCDGLGLEWSVVVRRVSFPCRSAL